MLGHLGNELDFSLRQFVLHGRFAAFVNAVHDGIDNEGKECKVDDPHGHLEPKRLRDVGFDVNLYLCLLAGPDAVAVGAAYFQNIVATRDVSYIDRRLVL